MRLSRELEYILIKEWSYSDKQAELARMVEGRQNYAQ